MIQLIGLCSIAFTLVFTLWAAFQESHHGGQSMRDSIIETWSNIAIGFAINYALNLLVLPLAGLPVSAAGAFWIGAIFTGVSVARSFLLRRVFNRRTVQKP
jgi:hypothetical protein